MSRYTRPNKSKNSKKNNKISHKPSISRETRPNNQKIVKKIKKYPKNAQYVEGNTSQQIKKQ